MAPSVTYYNGANNGVGGSTNKNVAGVSWGAGDLVIALGMPGDGAVSLSTPTNANLPAFTSLPGLPAGSVGNTMNHYAWKADAASAQSGQTIVMTSSTSDQMITAVLVLAAGTHGGIGVNPKVNVNTSNAAVPPQDTLAGVSAGSLLLAQVGNWGQASLASHTYRTDQAGTATQRTVLDNSTYGTGEFFTYNDAGAAGSKTVGWLTPNGLDWSIVIIEILAATGPAPQEILPDADTVTTGWTTTPLFSKLNDGSDATVVTATLV